MHVHCSLKFLDADAIGDGAAEALGLRISSSHLTLQLELCIAAVQCSR